ncbi:MAG TPA: penicillin-binding protein 2, partial [Micromonosporaceae bacterium]
MARRSDEPQARRRGASRAGGSDRERGTGRVSSISDARAYTPRARTVREAPELRLRGGDASTGRDGDPSRPALQVLHGGRSPGPDRAAAAGGRRDAGSARFRRPSTHRPPAR